MFLKSIKPNKTLRDEYHELIGLSKKFANIIGIRLFDLKWSFGRLLPLMLYQGSSIISNGFVADQVLTEGNVNLNVFSTCVVILSATALVSMKILIVIFTAQKFNQSFKWIERCYCEEYDQEIAEIWKKVAVKCKENTLFYTRILYRMYFSCISLMFAFNLAFNRKDPPLEFYALFIDEQKSLYYIGNFIYQLVLFMILLLCAGAVEGVFVLLIQFASSRYIFIVELLKLMYTPKSHRDSMSQIKLINFIVKLHIDVVSEVHKISDLFKTMLLIQMIGSLGTEIFSFFILQSHFYFTMIFASASPIWQVFIYCYLGDKLVEMAALLPNQIYATNWYNFTAMEKRHLLIMMRQSQQPIYLTIGGYAKLNLNTFVELGKSAFSFCAVLTNISS